VDLSANRDPAFLDLFSQMMENNTANCDCNNTLHDQGNQQMHQMGLAFLNTADVGSLCHDQISEV